MRVDLGVQKKQKNSPAGFLLFSLSINLFLYDLPSPPPPKYHYTVIYSDDLAIALQQRNFRQTANSLQQNVYSLERWLIQNHMSASPSKSAVTLFTIARQKSNANHPFNQPILLERHPTINTATHIDIHKNT